MKRYVLKKTNQDISGEISTLTESLNSSQKQAVLHTGSPLLIIAGAGSGKTKTLVHRVARLVLEGTNPQQILLLTFTRKAAQEMTKRATLLLDSRCQQIQGGTFHAFSQTILQEHPKEIGYQRGFTITDRSDSEDIVGYVRKKLEFNKLDKRFPKKRTLLSIISKSRNTTKTIGQILEQDFTQFSMYENYIQDIAKAYEKEKRRMNVMDYDDLLNNLVLLLANYPDIRAQYQNQFQHILVDEYQDTNKIQSQIVKFLAGENPNITVVGDDCQSIYSFRGANFKNIIDFPNLFPGTQVIKLEENYRTTQPILDLTNAVINQAHEKFDKTLFSSKTKGSRPIYIETRSENEQSQFVCQKILELREEGVDLKDIAVLIRSGWQSNDLEVELKAHHIPFVKYGGFKFVETAHVKDVVAYLRLAYNPRDFISWQRVLGLIEGVGPKATEDITQAVLAKLEDPLKAMEGFAKKKYFKELASLLVLLFPKNRDTKKPEAWIESIFAFYKPIFQLTYDDHNKRLNDLESLQVIASRFKNLETFLTELSLEPPEGAQDDSLPESQDNEKMTISTIHSAKGLEWKAVFAISMIDGYLPSFQSLGDRDQVEEERRLLYVALTRAKDHLFIIKPHINSQKGGYYAFQGMQFSKLSRFLDRDNYKQDLMEQWSLESEADYGHASHGSRQSMGHTADLGFDQTLDQPWNDLDTDQARNPGADKPGDQNWDDEAPRSGNKNTSTHRKYNF